MASPHINYDVLVKGFVERPRIALVRRHKELCMRNILRLQKALDAEKESFEQALSAHAFAEAASGSENPQSGTELTTPPQAIPDLEHLAAKADRMLRDYCTSL
jgi:hypothetical protein